MRRFAVGEFRWPEGIAEKVLAKHGLDPDEVEEVVLRLRGDHTQGPEQPVSAADANAGGEYIIVVFAFARCDNGDLGAANDGGGTEAVPAEVRRRDMAKENANRTYLRRVTPGTKSPGGADPIIEAARRGYCGQPSPKEGDIDTRRRGADPETKRIASRLGIGYQTLFRIWLDGGDGEALAAAAVEQA